MPFFLFFSPVLYIIVFSYITELKALCESDHFYHGENHSVSMSPEHRANSHFSVSTFANTKNYLECNRAQQTLKSFKFRDDYSEVERRWPHTCETLISLPVASTQTHK